jgi:hypothetical protein
VIRNIEQTRCGETQPPETLFGKHTEDFPPLVLPSTDDLDNYVAMMADEEKIRGLTSNADIRARVRLPSILFLHRPGCIVER